MLNARQQFVSHLLLEFAQLLSAGLEALLLLQLKRPGLGDLIDDGRGQQLLLGAEHQQHLPVV